MKFNEQTVFFAENLADVLTTAIFNHGKDHDKMTEVLKQYSEFKNQSINAEVVECAKEIGYTDMSELLKKIVSNAKVIRNEKIASLVSLEVGKEYTIVGYGDFGFLYQIHIKLESVNIKRYAQYDEAAELIFKIKNKRYAKNLLAKWFLPVDSFAIWEGHVQVDTNMWGKEKETPTGMIMRESKGSAFDSIHGEQALKSTTQKPIINYLLD